MFPPHPMSFSINVLHIRLVNAKTQKIWVLAQMGEHKNIFSPSCHIRQIPRLNGMSCSNSGSRAAAAAAT